MKSLNFRNLPKISRILADEDVDNLNFPPPSSVVIKTSQSKIFKTSVTLSHALSKVEQKVKFNPRVKQNDWKEVQIMKK